MLQVNKVRQITLFYNSLVLKLLNRLPYLTAASKQEIMLLKNIIFIDPVWIFETSLFYLETVLSR